MPSPEELANIELLSSKLANLNAAQQRSPVDHAAEIKVSKQLRVDLDAILQRLKLSAPSRERSLAVTWLQMTIMWLGMDLKERNAPNPYPNSYKPENAIVEPTADGMKM